MVYRDSCASTKRDSFKNVTVTTFTKLALLLNSIEMGKQSHPLLILYQMLFLSRE